MLYVDISACFLLVLPFIGVSGFDTFGTLEEYGDCFMNIRKNNGRKGGIDPSMTTNHCSRLPHSITLA